MSWRNTNRWAGVGVALLVVGLSGTGCTGERPGRAAPTAAGPTGPTGASGEFAPGAPGIGDPYFPMYGNGGYDVRHYTIKIKYDPGADQLTGVTIIEATATAGLSRFNLD